MAKQAALPLEFSALAGKIHDIRRVTNNEWSSSCPKCGSNPKHVSDRFRMWPVSKHGLPLGWCRACGYIWTPKNERPPSRDEFEQWRKQQIDVETKRKEDAERAIALLRSEKIWEFYHANQGEYGQEFWLSRGISEDWQKHWKLGMYGNYHIASDYSSPAGTIPVWQEDGQVSNVKLRIVKPRDNTERYRSLYKTGEANLFFALPANEKLCLVVEGEIKAMVCAMHSSSDIQVVGLPSKTPDKSALTSLDKYGKLILCLDPDADPRAVAKQIGNKTKVMYLADKIDDYILANELDGDWLRGQIKQARRVN